MYSSLKIKQNPKCCCECNTWTLEGQVKVVKTVLKGIKHVKSVFVCDKCYKMKRDYIKSI